MQPFAAEDELQVNPALFAELQSELVTSCNIDACATVNGSNALLPDYCCAGSKSFFDTKFAAGDFLWLHTPRQHRELFLARYRLHKQRCPELGACLLLPPKYSSPVLKNMKLLRRFARNTPLFVDATSGQTVRCKCDFVVYVDKPHVVSATQVRSQVCGSTAHDTPDSQQDTSRPSTTHVMQLTGTVAGATAVVLFNSTCRMQGGPWLDRALIVYQTLSGRLIGLIDC